MLSPREEAEAHAVAYNCLVGGDGITISATHAQAKRIFDRAREIVEQIAAVHHSSPSEEGA